MTRSGIRCDLWVCRLGALVVGLTSGGFYAVRRWRDSYLEVGALGPSVDDVTTAIVVAVTCWLLLSLAIARRHETVRARVVPGLGLCVVAGLAFVVASRLRDWPVTGADAAISFAIGMLGSIGVLIVPGSLRENPWSRAKPERD